MTAQKDNRLNYLDAVRSFALILGIIFHASLSFIPIFIGWAVMDVSTSDIVSAFAFVSHSFRMELFFLIAGYFAHMKFHQQDFKTFFNSKVIRIGIPFIIGWLLLRPLLISGWIMGSESMRGDVNIITSLETALTQTLTTPNELFTGSHLWFLYYLLLISLTVAATSYMVNKKLNIKLLIVKPIDKLVRLLCQSKLGLLIVIPPTALCLWFMQNWGVDTPDKSLIPMIPVTLIYGLFFLLGWLIHRQPKCIEQFSSLSWYKVLACLTGAIIATSIASTDIKQTHDYYFLTKIGFVTSYAFMMWTLIMLTMGMCQKLFSKENHVTRYIADASYWLYLIHLPLVIWLQIAFAELEIHWILKLVSVSSITLFISIILYDLFIRSTFIGRLLNGQKKTRKIFARKVKLNQVPVKNDIN